MIEQQLFSILSSALPITTICDSRIYPLVLPTDPTLPAITYSLVGGSSRSTQDTQGNQRYRIEVNCWGNTYGDAVTLRYAVISALGQYSADGIFISLIQPTDFFDHDLLQYRAMAEFYVFSNFN